MPARRCRFKSVIFERKAFGVAFNALPVRGYCARDSSGNPFLSEARKRLERIARARVCGKRQKKDWEIERLKDWEIERLGD